MNRTRTLIIVMVAVVAVLSASCTGTEAEQVTTTTTSTILVEIPDLEFGSGEVPLTLPDGFPFPDTAVIGTTMIDGVNGRTEMIVNFPANVMEVAAFYQANLPILGFEITETKGNETEWDIAFSKDGASGTIKLTFGGSGLSSGVFVFIHP